MGRWFQIVLGAILFAFSLVPAGWANGPEGSGFINPLGLGYIIGPLFWILLLIIMLLIIDLLLHKRKKR